MNIIGSTHLSSVQRIKIQELLGQGKKCKEIAKELKKDERTISREVKHRRQREVNGRSKFNSREIKECPQLNRFPFVCNHCRQRYKCTYSYKYYYNATYAQDNYQIILKDSRTGIDMTLSDKQTLDTILKNGVDKGQSIHHIVASHPSEIKCSTRSVYRYVDKQQTVIQNIDLRRKVKLKPRRKYIYKDDNKEIRNGRRYEDFLAFIGLHVPFSITELDTVESVRDGTTEKCIMTIHFASFRFMIGILLPSKTKDNVTDAFIKLQMQLGDELYSRLFPLILTDRGVEFCDPVKMEFSVDTGEKLTSVFFCDSYASYQKGAIEENHTLVRYILPKGTSFIHLTQEKVDMMMSHINSYNRKSISSTPYNLFKAFYGEETLNKLKIRAINPDLVTLSPNLLK